MGITSYSLSESNSRGVRCLWRLSTSPKYTELNKKRNFNHTCCYLSVVMILWPVSVAAPSAVHMVEMCRHKSPLSPRLSDRFKPQRKSLYEPARLSDSKSTGTPQPSSFPPPHESKRPSFPCQLTAEGKRGEPGGGYGPGVQRSGWGERRRNETGVCESF